MLWVSLVDWDECEMQQTKGVCDGVAAYKAGRFFLRADVCLQRRRKPRPTVMRGVFSRVSGCELPTGELVMAFFLGARLISAAVPLFFFR